MMAGLKLRPQYSEPVEFNIYDSLRKEWSEKRKQTETPRFTTKIKVPLDNRYTTTEQNCSSTDVLNQEPIIDGLLFKCVLTEFSDRAHLNNSW